MRRNGPAVIGQLPCAPGVYRFRDALGRVLYVGRATTLRSRVASYWSDLRMPLVTAGMQHARRRRRAGRDPARVGRLHAAHRRTRRKNGRIGAMSSIAPLASLGLLAWYAGLPARRLLSEPSQRGFVNVRGLIVLSGNS